MIAPSTMLLPAGRVPHSGRELLRLSDSLRNEAANELKAALEGVSGKRVRTANVPGAGTTFLSRSMNGADANPLYRLASLFLLLKRLGLGREAAQRLIDWQQEIVDAIWGPATDEATDLENVLDKEAELDGQDELPRLQASRGCIEGTRQLIEVKRRQRAHSRTVIMALRHALLMRMEGRE